MTNLTKMHAVRRIAGNLNRAHSAKVPLLIIALFAIIGFSMTACDDGNGNTHTCSFSTTWSSNTTTHYKQCSCGEKIDVENHVGNPCNVCGYNSGGSSSYSLDGVWETASGGWQTTFNGSSGVIASLGSSSNALMLDAINKGYFAIGTQEFRNLTSSGNLTWSGQSIAVMSNQSSPNVATGTSWVNCTITMNANGQTIQVSAVYASGNVTTNYTRSNYKLDGLWETTSGGWQTTFNGSNGVIASLGSSSNALMLDAINKGYFAIGTQEFRNLTSSGNLTWSGQSIAVMSNQSSPNVATGTSWVNCTITMNTNGQTIQISAVYASGNAITNYTRKR